MPATTPQAALVQQPYPQFIKYMGSKSKIMDFVLDGLNEVYDGGMVCDLFAGSGSLAGAIGRQVSFHSNDIQAYSSVLAGTYLNARKYEGMPSGADLVQRAGEIVQKNAKQLGLAVSYDSVSSLKKFNEIERAQQEILKRRFVREWHLFVKYYSGTWWSANQCLWIDALREISEEYNQQPCYELILSSLMHAMAYVGQGTGHYAQYRDAKTLSSMADILIYRRRRIEDYFLRKYDSATRDLAPDPVSHSHTVTTLDFKDCLAQFQGGTVYADPPYCFVHYSRFYHAIETLVKYDYPPIQVKAGEYVKGRYREDRHQSPFCIQSQVKQAFVDLFAGVQRSDSRLVLSYSNTGMISLEEVGELARQIFPDRKLDMLLTNHQHMTLGRQFDRHREVEECLLLVK
ncbi:MAG: DNA adenine methylase [Pseudomonadota bacterium]